MSDKEWRDRYRRALRQLCKTASEDALDPDNILAMKSRRDGKSPEVAAGGMATLIEAWSEEKPPQ